MKQKLIILILFFGFCSFPIFAATPTPETTGSAEKNQSINPTQAPQSDKIQELKDRVANRVAQLRKEKLNGITGLVKSSSDGALILTKNDKDYSIQLEEEGKVYEINNSLKKTDIKLSSIEKGKSVTIIGTINEDEKSAIAKVVVEKEPVNAYFGKVSSVSTKDGTISFIGQNNTTYVADVEITTTINTYDAQKDKISKFGLSKIEEGAKIHVYGTFNTELNKISAQRILILPNDLFTKIDISPTTKPLSPTPKISPKPTSSKSSTPTPQE